jgi:hypothetical protein
MDSILYLRWPNLFAIPLATIYESYRTGPSSNDKYQTWMWYYLASCQILISKPLFLAVGNRDMW